MEAGNSLEFLLAEVELLSLDQKQKDNLSWEIEEAKILYDLECERKRTANLLIYSAYGIFAIAAFFLILYRQSGESLFWPLTGIGVALLLFFPGKKLRNYKESPVRQRLLKKGKFKRF